MTYQHSPDEFDEHTLKTLNQAVTDIRDVPDAFHRHLASTLVDLTDAGVADRKELCSRALNLIFHEATALMLLPLLHKIGESEKREDSQARGSPVQIAE